MEAGPAPGCRGAARVSDFDYPLPAERIAQGPLEERDAARLLVSLDPGGAVQHRRVRDLPHLLARGDLLVVNDTRVMAARLRLRKETGGSAEVVLLEAAGDGHFHALIRPGRRLAPGTRLYGQGENGGRRPVVEVGDRPAPNTGELAGLRLVRVLDPKAVEEMGEVPLPPYIGRPLADPERYQVVYSRLARSVAAPTAGLHLTHALLDRCRAAGVEVATVDLAVGPGTFRPMTADLVDDHVMHSERYDISFETVAALERARRVVAVGTTTVRALEAAARTGELSGRTELFIRRPFEFKVVDVLLTNFHLPRSSLLALVDALIGSRWRVLYSEALSRGYRFLSFGDAMLIARAGSCNGDT